MDKLTLQKHCMTLHETTTDYQEEWGANRYHIGGKMYAMFGTDAKGVEVVTMKCDPERAVQLREQHDCIIQGYYMNKTHWNSVYLHGDLPQSFVEQLLSDSYHLVFANLTKKVQRNIMGK